LRLQQYKAVLFLLRIANMAKNVNRNNFNHSKNSWTGRLFLRAWIRRLFAVFLGAAAVL